MTLSENRLASAQSLERITNLQADIPRLHTTHQPFILDQLTTYLRLLLKRLDYR